MESDLDDLQAALADQPEAKVATIDHDLVCVHCGENLMGAARRGSCPACHASVAMSLTPERLYFADPAWLRTVRRGLTWMALSMVAWAPLSFALNTAMRWIELPEVAWRFVVLVSPILCSTIMAIGVFKMTIAEPVTHAWQATPALRRFVRVAGIAAGVAVPAFWIPATLPQIADAPDWIEPPDWLKTVLKFGLLAVPALIYAALVYLRTLALRMPNASLARSTGIVLIGLPVSVALLAVLPRTLFIPILFIGLSTLIFGLWALALIWGYATSFDESIRGARINARRYR